MLNRYIRIEQGNNQSRHPAQCAQELDFLNMQRTLIESSFYGAEKYLRLFFRKRNIVTTIRI